MLFVRRQPSSESIHAHYDPAWAYVGSANLSESAWGRLVKDKTTKAPKLTCRNWECGVLVPIHTADTNVDVAAPQTTCSMDVFRGRVPMPMLYPGEMYGARKPWYFTEQ